MRNAVELLESWEQILNEITDEEFDLENFEEVAKDTFATILTSLKENPSNVSIDVVKLLIKVTKFSQREIFCAEQEAAQYMMVEILWGVENGIENLDIDDNNVLFMYAPNSYDRIGVDLNTFDLSELLGHFDSF
jgi:DNA-binding transcriptional regulator PaaX